MPIRGTRASTQLDKISASDQVRLRRLEQIEELVCLTIEVETARSMPSRDTRASNQLEKISASHQERLSWLDQVPVELLGQLPTADNRSCKLAR
jgi:hypothetical protein